MKRRDLTQEILREMFDYRADGLLIHRAWKGQKLPPGTVAGRLYARDGYLRARVRGHTIAVHTLVFIWHHGRFPTGCIDHIDRNRLNNRIENLRDVTKQQNAFNRDVRGASLCPITKKKWIAKIKANGREIVLGRFCDEQSAHAAYLEAKAKYHVIGGAPS